MVVMSYGFVVGKMYMYEVFCVLCVVKFDDKVFRINVWGCFFFLIEVELRKLLLKFVIDDNICLCFFCLCKLKKKKFLEENFVVVFEEIV